MRGSDIRWFLLAFHDFSSISIKYQVDDISLTQRLGFHEPAKVRRSCGARMHGSEMTPNAKEIPQARRHDMTVDYDVSADTSNLYVFL